MKDLRETVSISLYANHRKVLEIWSNKTGWGVSQLLRYLVEEHSNHRFEKTGLFGWTLLPPKFEREHQGRSSNDDH